MYHNEHPPPHFHVYYNQNKAAISIQTLEIVQGKIPSRVYSLVLEWASKNRKELEEKWTRVEKQESLKKIRPLK